MKLRKLEIISAGFVLFSFVAAYFVYPQLPDQVASHWNIRGEVDGYMSRFWGAFLMPTILTGMLILFLVIPRVDTKRENIEKFRVYLDRFILLLIVFMLYVHSLTLAWNLGYMINLMRFLSPAFALLFYYTGVLIAHAQQNWSIGIRTPWTLSSPTVWQKTHRLGGALFKGSALLALLGVLLPSYAIWFILAPVLTSSLWAIIYSYLEYRKIAKP